jgi:hypothetical protein
MIAKRAAGVAALLLAFEAEALGANVGIVASKDGEPFAVQIGLELEQLGFSVAREEVLAARSQELILLRVSEGDLELYEVSSDGELHKRDHAFNTVARRDALKVAEEVRALLLPLVKASAPPFELPVAAPPAPAPAPAEQPPVVVATTKTIEASASGGVFFGGSTPGAVVGVALALFPRSFGGNIGVGLDATLPVIAESVDRVQGTTDVRAFMAGPEVIGRLVLVPRALAADLALGARLAHLRFEGAAKAPFTSRTDSAWSWSPTSRLRLHYETGPVSVFVEGRLGISLPAIAVRHAGGTTHEWGVPWMTAGAGVAYAF